MNKKICIILTLAALFISPVFVFGQNVGAPVEQQPLLNSKEFSLQSITSSIEDVDLAALDLKKKVRLEINLMVNQVVEKISAEKNIQPYILLRSVDAPRAEIFDYLEVHLKDTVLFDLELIDDLESLIIKSLDSIKKDLASTSNTEVDLTSAKNIIASHLNKFRRVVESNRAQILENNGELIFLDSDNDGISDFEEIYIYNTDPYNPKTVEGELNDGEKILLGIDPTSATEEPRNFADPRESGEFYISKAHKVESVQIDDISKFIKIKGTAIPNSYVTVYIFSTPIIVTLKTDDRGEWTYTLDKALDDGSHEIYVATVNNSGKILARSEGNIFAKSAGAITMGAMGELNNSNNLKTGNYLHDNYIIIISIILLLGLVITISLFGKKPNESELIGEDDKNK